MIRMTRAKTASIAVTAFFAVAASAQVNAAEPAFISKIDGKGVTLSRGQDTVSVRVQTLLSTGDRVTAADGSTVEVTYLEDGCILNVAKGKSITISNVSPCASAAATKPTTETQAQQVVAGESEARVEPAAADDVPVEVTEITGPVARANLGEGLVDLSVGQMLNEGDTVFAGQNSTVTLYFVDPKCYYTLEPETYLEITDDPPCRRAAAVPLLGAAAALGVGGFVVFMLTRDDDDDDDRPVTPN